MNSVQVIEIKRDQHGQRVDNYLSRVMHGLPKSRIYRLIRKGEIRVNKGRIKPNHRLQEGDVIRIPPYRVEEKTEPSLPANLLDVISRAVLYEDEHCLVVNKPAGLAVHGGSGLKFGLLDVLKAIRPDADYLELAHRLDRETSGCLLVAKNRQTLIYFHEQFKEHTLVKKYFAGVIGNWQHGTITVRAALKKQVLKGGERMVEVDEKGKDAATRFSLLEHFKGLSLLEVELETGRTHQIRVHAQHMGHPVAGDQKYGDREQNMALKSLGLKHLFLHAHWLEFQLPNAQEPIMVTTPMPTDLQQTLDQLA
jgi:23S rRNA pseudouridine955/2504/2580 synthase